LCTGDDATGYKCICFDSDNLTEEMIENCIEIGTWKDNHNLLFEHFWKHNVELLDKASLNDKNFFTLVHSKVWKRTISCCESLLIKFHDKSVTLENVEEFTMVESFSEHLSALCCALQQCYPDFKSVRPSKEWIQSLMCHIEKYQSETFDHVKCADAANFVLKIKNSLHLSGDFGIVESLSNNVRIKYS